MIIETSVNAKYKYDALARRTEKIVKEPDGNVLSSYICWNGINEVIRMDEYNHGEL